MFSVLPGTPARTQQMPRTIISTRTPAQLASLSLAMISGSLMELFFRIIEAGRPLLARAISLSISFIKTLLKRSGATSMVSTSLVRRCSAILLNTALASSPICWSAVMKDRSVYCSLVFSL